MRQDVHKAAVVGLFGALSCSSHLTVEVIIPMAGVHYSAITGMQKSFASCSSEMQCLVDGKIVHSLLGSQLAKHNYLLSSRLVYKLPAKAKRKDCGLFARSFKCCWVCGP